MKYIHIRIPKLKAISSRDVFVLFSALNAMGYDDENNPEGMTPARKKVRRVLLGYNWNEKYPRLKRAIEKNHPWHLLNAILAKSKKIKKASVLGGFISDFRKFSDEPLARELWQIFKIRQAKEAKKLLPLFERKVTKLVAFISRPPPELKKIVLIINPLDSYWNGYTFGVGVGFWRGVEGVGYIVIGPYVKKRQIELLIRHELLHLLAPALRLPRRIIAGQHRNKRLVAMGYGVPSVINREYVVRSLNLYYESVVLKMDISKAIKREEKDFPHIRKAIEFMRAKKEMGRL